MKALSLKQPWAWPIFHAGKDIENRPRRTNFRGTIAIHTSQRPYDGWEEWYPKGAAKPPPQEEWMIGAIIGLVDIVDCVDDHPSRWFFKGSYGYVLENARLLRK